MPRFLGVEVQTDVRCASGVTVAFFPAADLAVCRAVLSPTEPETLTIAVRRDDPRADELIAGRVLRTRFADATADREWDISEFDDASTDALLGCTARPIGLRMGAALYLIANASTGLPETAFTIVGVNATEAIDTYVLPPLVTAGLSWITRGTVDSTARFDLSGEWATVLEIVRALCDPGRANGEWQLRRNGDTGYLLDIVDAVGGSAAALTLHSSTNLLATRRSQSLLDAATRLFARGSDVAAERTMAAHLWRVKTVVDSEWLELEDIAGGDGPVGFDDQLNGLYLAVMNAATFASQLVADSVASTQRVQVPSTTGITAGEWCRFFKGSTSTGARVTSLQHPTRSALPSAGGLGDRTQLYDVPAVRGDCNLVPNPSMRTWTTPTSPPDGWTVTEGTPANAALARETTIVRDAPYTLRLTTSGSTTLSVETDDVPVWAVSALRHFCAIWFNVQAVPAAVDSAIICEAVTPAGVLIAELGRWVRGSDPALDTWFRFTPDVKDFSGVTTAVRIRLRFGTTTSSTAASGWDVVVGPALVAESEIEVEDIDYSGGTVLWQVVNRALADASAATRELDVRVIDLEADDPDVFSDFEVVPGQDCTVVDDTLAESATQRVVEYRPDYLQPLTSTIRIGVPPKTFTSLETIPLPPVDEVPEAEEEDLALAWLDVRYTIGTTAYTIEWDGDPDVKVSINGGAYATPSASPFNVSRNAAGGAKKTYMFRAGPDDLDKYASFPVTVDPQESTPSTDPALTGGWCSGGLQPGDGGGEAEITFTHENAPVGWTVDIAISNVSCDSGIFDSSETDTGVTASPHTVNLALGPGAEFDVLITLRNSGGTELDTRGFHVSVIPE